VKILLYVEPHPIRNTQEQFLHVGRLLARALLHAASRDDFEFRIVANRRVADHLLAEMPQLHGLMCPPTASESASMQAFDRTWDESSIRTWLDLVSGRGPATALYVSLLRRVHEVFAFDVVLLWAENGAVRIAARELGAVTVHGELGPTRAPFPRTIYLDARGTNGNASVRTVSREVLDEV
jgi:hypothetical protein